MIASIRRFGLLVAFTLSFAIGHVPLSGADTLEGDAHWQLIKERRKKLLARLTTPYGIEELTGNLDDLPWRHWRFQKEGGFETGGRISGEEPFPFHLEYGPRGESGNGLFDSRSLSWNINKDLGERYARLDNFTAREDPRHPLGPEGGYVLFSGDRSGSLHMWDKYRSGLLRLNDGKRLSWRWVDQNRHVLWSGLGTGAVWLGAVQPGRVDLRKAYFRGDFQMGDSLLKPRLYLDKTSLRWSQTASQVSGGLYEQSGPSILLAEADFDQGRWQSLKTRVEDELIPTGGDQDQWFQALSDLQDAVRLKKITINARLLDRRVEVGYRPADKFLHMIARDFPVVEMDLSGVDRPIDVALASQQITGLPLNRLLENQEKLLLSNFSQTLYREKTPAYLEAFSSVPSFGAVSSGSVQFLNQSGFTLEDPLYDQEGGIRLGYRHGAMASLTPLFDGASYTQLGIQGGDVDVAQAGWRQPLLTGPAVSLAVEGMAYVANFQDELQISLEGPRDPMREEFLTFRAPEGILMGEVAEEKISNLTLPGGFLGVEASAFDERVGLRYRAVPYLPITIGAKSVEGEESGDLRGLLEIGDTIGYASDISAFVKQPVLGREVFAALHKDAADRLEAVSSYEVFPGVKPGIRLGQARVFGDLRTAFVNARWGANTAAASLQEDEAHQARGYDLRMGRLWGGRQWEAGMTLKHYLTGVENDGFDPLLEREWTLSVSDPAGHKRLILAYGDDTLEGKSSLFAGIERSVSDSLRWKGGAELTTFQEDESELRGSFNLRWLF
jgi:hypothetical protein